MSKTSRIDIIGLNGPTGDHYMDKKDCYKYPTEEFIDYQTKTNPDVKKISSSTVESHYKDEYNIEAIEKNVDLETLRRAVFKNYQEYKKNKKVEHPNWMSDSIETWDISKYLDHCTGSAVDYLIKQGKKDNTTAIEDCENAIQWILKRIEVLKEG